MSPSAPAGVVLTLLTIHQKEEWAALGIDVVKEMDELEAMLASLNTPGTPCAPLAPQSDKGNRLKS
jgi:hypothetical protein